ncbi:MAG TPA: CBS domain-containing protein [Acidimicrobiia bacterium]|jgi:CBS domain-containing protein|nr:CBS domain-containing protein [Acidimicrobiia bacterium]
MKIQDLMTTNVITIGPEASLKEAARRMIEAGVSGLPVTDDSGSLVGVITEADFVKAESGRRAAKRARLLRWFTRDDGSIADEERRVGDVMTTEVITIPAQADHVEAARLMRSAGIKRIPVVEDSRVVGLVSRSDILRAFARPDSEIISEITEYLMPKVLWIDPRAIRISCVEGNVVLSGRLETRSDVQLLVELTRRLDGVVSVQDHLTWEIDNEKLPMVSPIPSSRNW